MEKTSEKEEEKIADLRQEVEAAFGRPITSNRDCILLAEEIYGRTSFNLNSNTLRRFFGLVTATYPASLSTLNILAKYCGFESVEEFKKTKRQSIKDSEDTLRAQEILAYFISIYKYTPVRGYSDETFLSVTKQTVQFLQKHPFLAEDFQRTIAKTKNGQEFYFEQFVNIDGLNGFYGDGLRYYLNEKKTEEAQSFGHSLLCVRAWLSEDEEEVVKEYKEVMKYKLPKNTHSFVLGCYYATQLYYANSRGGSTQDILAEAHRTHVSLKQPGENYRLFPAFEYVLSIALLLTEHYEEAHFFSDYSLKNYPSSRDYVEEGFYQTVQMIQALTLVHKGDKAKAEEIWQVLKPSGFYFLTKKVNTMIYIYLSKLLKKTNTKWDEQFRNLVFETGFIKLAKYGG